MFCRNLIIHTRCKFYLQMTNAVAVQLKASSKVADSVIWFLWNART